MGKVSAAAPRILFVDDELPVLLTLKRRLRDRYRIHTALDGANALDVVEREGPFAVVVSDMRMPCTDGLEFLTELKKRAPDTARIMLTGDSDPRTAIDAVNEGRVFRFLQKPCSAEVIACAIEEAVSEHEARRGYGSVVGGLIGSFQHEFRTPLNAIIGFASFLEDGGAPPGAIREYASYIRESGQSLLTMAEGVITLAAINEGRCRARPACVGARAFIRTLRQLYGPAADERDVSLNFETSCSSDEFYADLRLITLAVGALVSNALKHSPPGRRVSVTFTAGVDTDVYDSIEVRDMGPGMSAACIADVEYSSQHTETMLVRRHGGLGLGLPLARAIASLHGGRLQLSTLATGGLVARLLLKPARAAMEANGLVGAAA